MREEEEEDGEEEACDSNEIPFTAASDLSLSPNGESRRKRRDGKKEEAWKEGRKKGRRASERGGSQSHTLPRL